ncbi:hypothetical protein Nepgr_023877 [Nepenthes gracilis]|uniref:Ataxin 2 SM domain-containing protein n=1 Tax=Nepenthes gracilis TaxID=150966 RepID=A0AAD3XZI2_NEPGR|nr:hypothetical protein Nepgr_023877 [Nepenthes gracilis]
MIRCRVPGLKLITKRKRPELNRRKRPNLMEFEFRVEEHKDAEGLASMFQGSTNSLVDPLKKEIEKRQVTKRVIMIFGDKGRVIISFDVADEHGWDYVRKTKKDSSNGKILSKDTLANLDVMIAKVEITMVGLESAAWMSLQQAIQSRSTSNGFSHRRVEKCDTAGSKSGGYESPSPDRLVCLTSRLIGHQVDVQVKNGSVFSGIFHETNANEDFGIVLKMACLTNDASSRVQKAASDTVSKAPSKTLIYELVQVTAKVVMTISFFCWNELSNDTQHEKQLEIMLDSYVSHPRRVEWTESWSIGCVTKMFHNVQNRKTYLIALGPGCCVSGINLK